MTGGGSARASVTGGGRVSGSERPGRRGRDRRRNGRGRERGIGAGAAVTGGALATVTGGGVASAVGRRLRPRRDGECGRSDRGRRGRRRRPLVARHPVVARAGDRDYERRRSRPAWRGCAARGAASCGSGSRRARTSRTSCVPTRAAADATRRGARSRARWPAGSRLVARSLTERVLGELGDVGEIARPPLGRLLEARHHRVGQVARDVACRLGQMRGRRGVRPTGQHLPGDRPRGVDVGLGAGRATLGPLGRAIPGRGVAAPRRGDVAVARPRRPRRAPDPARPAARRDRGRCSALGRAARRPAAARRRQDSA